MLELRRPDTPDENNRGGDCDAMLTARSRFFQRVPDKDAPFLDPDRQQLMRAQIESDFP
jgi:hypothetical protein